MPHQLPKHNGHDGRYGAGDCVDAFLAPVVLQGFLFVKLLDIFHAPLQTDLATVPDNFLAQAEKNIFHAQLGFENSVVEAVNLLLVR